MTEPSMPKSDKPRVRVKVAAPPPRVATPSRPRRNWLATAGYVGFGIACVVLAVVTFLVLAAPLDAVRDQVVRQLRAETGRNVSVNGPTSLTLFPRLAVSFTNLTFAAPSDMGGAPTVVVGSLDAELGLASLFRTEPDVRRIVVNRPAVDLRVNAQGRRSWENAPGATAVPGQPARATPTAAMLDKITLQSIRVVDGTVRYLDERGGKPHEVRGLEAEVTLAGITAPAQARGSLTLNGERLTFEGALAPLRALLDGQQARVNGRFSGNLIAGSYDGMAGLQGGSLLRGNFSLKAPSLKAVGTWLGEPVSAGADPGALSLSGSITADERKASVTGLQASIGDFAFSGALALDGSGPRPRLTGDLRLTDLDMARMFRAADQVPPRPSQVPPGTPKSDKPPAVDWSNEAIDLTSLGLADANLTLSVARVRYRDLATGAGKVTFAVKDKVATLSLDELDLYGGKCRGSVTLDGSAREPATRVDLTLEGVSALPVLKGALGFDWLEGQGNITVALAGRGASERQIMASLEGKVGMTMANGAIIGIDIAKMLRGLEQARFADLSPGADDRTPFNQFAANFQIAGGVAKNQDLKATSPRVQVTGSGSADLGRRTIDYTVRAKILGGAASESRLVNLRNLELPVRIEGSWDSPNLSVVGQERVLDTVRDIGKTFESPEVRDFLRDLFGGR